MKEIEFLSSFPVDEKVDESAAAGKEIIDTRWVDVNKGDWNAFNVRSRICAKEFKWKNPWMEDTFAGTPPWEGIKLVLGKAMTRARKPGGGFYRKKVFILDTSKAHFHPMAKRELYIRPPAEDHEDGKIGKLLFMMYGMRDAACGWEEFHREKLALAGYRDSLRKDGPAVWCTEMALSSRARSRSWMRLRRNFGST